MITIYGIDYIIKLQEKQRLIPLKAAAYEDIRLVVHWALDLWKTIFVESVGDNSIHSWDELFEKINLQRAMKMLDIRKPANINPPMPWGNFFDMNLQQIFERTEKIQGRITSSVEPEIYQAVSTLNYHTLSLKTVGFITNMDRANGIPLPSALFYHFAPIPEWFSALLILQKWTVSTHDSLVKSGAKFIYAPYAFPKLEVSPTPRAQLPESELELQINEFQKSANRASTVPRA